MPMRVSSISFSDNTFLSRNLENTLDIDFVKLSNI
ncbi:hypothetical protein BPP43_08665 [Brachyspira pilosicoli P43/6/78]|uniref:Uncharacterized protein n=1 Tax=Brachyspira pilosicoli P43/6/78 TaxID=1042417 RepID=A0A3B6VPI2_BRAPL|nr:hypothetical protein BPP43_08665 [Brachyspira pilosicoli P43/6/78]